MNDTGKDMEQHELDVIRMRKMKALMDAQKRSQAVQERTVTIFEKADQILRAVLAPDAYARLLALKENEPTVYQHIFNELISPDVLQNMDYLLSIVARGPLPRRIPLDVIIMLERKIKGIKSTIQVKRGDETLDLGSYLTK
ncbi:MAG: hypothetical protein JW891_01910 [Candidatus Lokiarchaeota archaeon]|nr:hypothetical protein [Candidatus Lokiarchaeota archaeon]